MAARKKRIGGLLGLWRKLAGRLPSGYFEMAAIFVTLALTISGLITQSNLAKQRQQDYIAASQTPICGGQGPAPLKYDHVIWIQEENKSFNEVINTPDAPFLSGLAKQCAFDTRYLDNEPPEELGHGLHSLSHYIAGVSGSNCQVGNGLIGQNCEVDYRNVSYDFQAPSLFNQLDAAGLTWKSYQESAPSNCAMKSAGDYVTRHDAVVHLANLRSECEKYDIPFPAPKADFALSGQLIDDIKNNQLPNFAYVTPDLNDDMHDGSVDQGDAWLKAYLKPLFASQTYKQGRTAVFVIWDEASSAGHPLPNMFIAPTAHGSSAVPVNGFSVLGATENMLSLPYLGCAGGRPPGLMGGCPVGSTTNIRDLFDL